MKSTTKIGSTLAVVVLVAVGGCANPTVPTAANTSVSSASGLRSGYGVVESIEIIQDENTGIGGSGVGVGAVAGAVVGGIVGSQIGSGRGNTAATIAGAAGGAYVGHEIEKSQRLSSTQYKITVRMNNGSYQSLLQDTDAGLRVGERVRIEDGLVRRY
ncbi:MAG: glycine zipper 2TM domain-containing protein [Propionivibrio sp.]